MSGNMSGFSVPDIVRSSQPTIVYSPNISGAIPPSITQSQLFSWSPSGADWIQIRLGQFDTSTYNYSEVVTCIVFDDGSFTIDGSNWNNWSPGNQIDIYFTRVVEQISVLPHNNSYARVVGEYTLVGAAISQ